MTFLCDRCTELEGQVKKLIEENNNLRVDKETKRKRVAHVEEKLTDLAEKAESMRQKYSELQDQYTDLNKKLLQKTEEVEQLKEM